MNNRFMINYSPGTTPIHKLNGTTKVIGFIAITIYVIMTFDVRVMAVMFTLCCAGIISMKPNWKPVFFMFCFLFVTAGLFGTLMILLIRPSSGLSHVGAETIIVRFNNHLFLSKELLWYAGAMFFKRMTSFSTAILFILAITPSEFAAGLNNIGLPYKICTVVSLAFRTIPDIARDFTDIRNSLMMRGVELDSRKVGLFKRISQTVMILSPLILTAFGKVGNIANAMDLRSFGKFKKRSWYSEHESAKADWIARVIILIVAVFCGYYIVWHRILHPSPFDYWCPWVKL